MPSGYTEAVMNGEVTNFADFALSCSRAFGARVMERDNSEDSPWEPRTVSRYNIEQLTKAIDKLEELTARSPEQWQKAHIEAIAKQHKHIEERNAKNEEINNRYAKMIVFAEDYKAPTPEHENFKEFMIDQLASSIKFDVITSFTSDEDPDKITVDQFRDMEIERARGNIEYHSKQINEDADRVIGSNNWMYQLFVSLEKYK